MTAPTETITELDNYFEGLMRRGEKIPTWVRFKKPSFRAISAASGIDLKYLVKEPCKQRITLAMQEIGLTPLAGTPESIRKNRFEKNCLLLGDYFGWLADKGIKLPEDPRRRGQVFYKQLEIEAGLNPFALKQDRYNSQESYNQRLHQLVKDAIPRLGLEVRVLPQLPNQVESAISYEEFLKRGSCVRQRELSGRPNSDQQRYNTRWALNKFLKTLEIKKTDLITDEFTANFSDTVEKVMCTINSPDSKKKFQREINWWNEYYQCLVKESSIPEEFHPALKYLIDRSGLCITVLAKLINVGTYTLNDWYKGVRLPNGRWGAALSRLESLFKLLAGTLTFKIQSRQMRRYARVSKRSSALQDKVAQSNQIYRYVPDGFFSFSREKQEEIVVSISSEILSSQDPFTQKFLVLKKLPYRLKVWPDHLKQEFEGLASFKLAERPPIGMKRNKRWNLVTKKMREYEFGYLFGALSLPADAVDLKLRGLGACDLNLTIALIACPKVTDWYIEFRSRRCGQYTASIIQLLKNFKSLLAPGTGWLRQRPDLALRLSPLSNGSTNLITEQEISKACLDWETTCDEAIDYYNHLLKEIRPLVKLSRDPFYRIKGIVDLDNPMVVSELLMRGMDRSIPSRQTQAMLYHMYMRNWAVICLAIATGFRCGTLAQLNYTGDDSGNLYRKGKVYHLDVPREFFKDKDSSYFGPKHSPADYSMEVPDKLGIYKVLKEYLEVSRPWLLAEYHSNAEEQPLFVNAANAKTVRLSSRRISDVYLEATLDHLAENKWRGTGISEAKGHRIHSVRHIRGTAIVKQTGSFRLAGDANQNTEETARKHYARFLPSDRNKKVNEVLFE